jgi:hypothetical protein
MRVAIKIQSRQRDRETRIGEDTVIKRSAIQFTRGHAERRGEQVHHGAGCRVDQQFVTRFRFELVRADSRTTACLRDITPLRFLTGDCQKQQARPVIEWNDPPRD